MQSIKWQNTITFVKSLQKPIPAILRDEQKEALKFCVSLLEERFGNIDTAITSRVQVLKKQKLEALGRAVLRISTIADLVDWLDQNESN